MDGTNESPNVTTRAGFYGVNMIPHSRISGEHMIIGAGDYTYGTFLEYYNQVITQESSLDISLELELNDLDLQINAGIEVVDNISSTNNKYFFAIVQKEDTDYSYSVVAASDPENFELTEIGETALLEHQFELDYHWNQEDLKVLVIVQNWQNPKNVLQAEIINLIYQPPNPVTPWNLDFGTVQVGETASGYLTVTNHWDTDLTGTISTGTDFSGPASFFVSPGESTDLEFSFSPTDHQVYIEEIIFNIDQPEYPESVIPVTGRGYVPETDFWTEDFDNEVFPPIGWVIDSHINNWHLTDSNLAGGTEPEVFTIASPEFIGYSRFCSIPTDLENADNVWLEFKHSLETYVSGFQVGVATSNDGLQWNTIWEISPSSDIAPETLRIPIDNGDPAEPDFRVCWYINSANGDIPNWYIDDISLYEPFQEDVMVESIICDSYFSAGDQITPQAVIMNIGISPVICDVELEFYQNNELLDNVTIYDLDLSVNESQTVSFGSITLPAENELYQLVVTAILPSDLNQNNNSQSHYVNTYTNPRQTVILEMATSTSCGYCPYASLGAEELVAEGADIAVIEYHSSDVFSTASGMNRLAYYEITGLPTSIFDGVDQYIGIVQPGVSMYPQFLATYNERITVPTHLVLDVNGYHDQEVYNLDIFLIRTAPSAWDDAVLHAVLTESEIPDPASPEDIYPFVQRLMIPDENGTPIDLINNDILNVPLEFSIESGWDIENSELIIFVQSEDSKEILQGIKLPLAQFGSVNSEETVLKNSILSLDNYPNPFNPTTKINFQVSGIRNQDDLELGVYNIKGQKIKTLTNSLTHQPTNHYTVTWDGRDDSGKEVSTGIYYIHLNAGKENRSKKILLIK
jgi:hypothetical protein